MKSKSIMRCMLLALLFLVLALVWTPNIMAQAQLSCSASASADPGPVPTNLVTGSIIEWNIKISNTSHTNYDPLPSPPTGNEPVAARLIADGVLAQHPPLELTMAVAKPGTFTALEKMGDAIGNENGICDGGEVCDCINLIGGMAKCVRHPTDANIILLYTNGAGVPFAAGEAKQIITVRARATKPSPTAITTSVVGFYDPINALGVISTDSNLCDPQVDGSAQGSATEFFPPKPCISVTKSVKPTKTKPGAADPVEYTIKLCNCGDIDLTGITVDDTKMGDLVPPFLTTLGKGTLSDSTIIPNCDERKFNWPIPSGTDVTVPYVNVVTATGIPAGGTQAISADPPGTASVELFNFDVDIVKTCPCTVSDQSIGCQVGDTVNYTITVTNKSTTNAPPITCKVDDNNPYFTIHDTFTWATSSPGQVKQYKKPITFPDIPEDCLTNKATLHCTIEGFPNVKDKDAPCEVCKETPSTSGGEEPFKAAIGDDKSIPDFHISKKLYQFTHPDTDYYANCTDILKVTDPRVTPECEPYGGPGYKCPSACKETFKFQASAVNQPEVCCTTKTVDDFTDTNNNEFKCPDINTDGSTEMISAGNGGWYEWVIALPKKPSDEMNIEIQCGVLKPNTWVFHKYDSIVHCAAVTGEPVALGGLCTRVTGAALKANALPTIEAIAHPGCKNNQNLKPFHLTAYKSPGKYGVSPFNASNTNIQVLDGSTKSRIALKGCMEESIMVVWPKAGRLNGIAGETEWALQAGDLIKVRMKVPDLTNTVDIYCGKYSVTIGGIGEPATLLVDDNCKCISNAKCIMDEL